LSVAIGENSMSLTASSSRYSWFIPWAKALSGLGLLTVLGCAPEAIAQPISVPPAMQSSDVANDVAQEFLFVDSGSGDDAGQGTTQRSPFRTLTRALQAVQSNNAQSNTIIMLAAGTYTPDTGEVFPLILPPGVMIQGDPSTKGQSIIIQGGGSFTTATAGRQNVAIVGTGQIVGVTVSNPNGYGVWIEAGSPIIANNTFTGSNLAGVAIMGNSTPTLWGNAFSHNRTGIAVAATAQPAIKDSLDQVGAATLAVSPAQRDSPPTAAIAQSTPTLNSTRPQSSVTLIQTPPAQSTASPVNRSRRSASSQLQITPPATVAPISLNPPIALTPPAGSAAHQSSRAARPSVVNIPVPAPQSERRRDLPVSRSIPIPVPPPEARAASASSFTAPPASSVQSNLLRVPAEPPIGNVGDLPVVNVSRNPLQYRESSTRQSAAVRGLRYRVVVAAGRRTERVRSLFPGAFATYSGGEAVLQVGAFGDRTNAEEAAQILDNNGLNGTIEALDN
jgi:parallel beta-helix repeat protein